MIRINHDRRSPVIGDKTATRIYHILEVYDAMTAKALALAAAPITEGILLRGNCNVASVGAGVWKATVNYAPYPEQPEAGSPSKFSFDIGQDTMTVTQARRVVSRTPDPHLDAAPNFKGAIGVGQDGRIAGCNVMVPTGTWTETHYLHAEVCDGDYQRTILKTAGKVNNGPFRGNAAHEVLFLGARGSKRDEETWEVTFSFAVSITENNIAIGDIVVAEKKGWDYLWVWYEEDVDAAVPAIVQVPMAAYVIEVYEEGNFLFLEIGF